MSSSSIIWRWITVPRAGGLIAFLMILLGICYGVPNRLLKRTRAATTFTVTTTTDGGPGSLRQAIIDANANAGQDMISFSIGSGVQTIILTTDLPIITDPVIIDGTTQPGFAGTPIIEVNGTGAQNHAGFAIAGGNSTVRGLVLNRFNTAAIGLSTLGGNHIEGNYIGTNVAGTARLSNGTGVGVFQSTNNVIGGTTAGTRNVISGNGTDGVDIGGGSGVAGNVIQGNYIGTNAAGTAALGNGSEGIRFAGSENCVAGGLLTGAGNLISGNGLDGIEIGGSGNLVQGNLIGTDFTGMFAVPNGEAGIEISNTPNHVVGGTAPGARNVISGNRGAGVKIMDSGAVGNTVQGNFIGTAIDGLTPLPNSTAVVNSSCGIFINRGNGNFIGGPGAGEGNLIAFNGTCGVSVISLPNINIGIGNSIRGNSIFANGGLEIDLDFGGVNANDVIDADVGANKRQNFPVISSFTSNGGSTTIQGTLSSAPLTIFKVDFYASSTCDPSGSGEGTQFFGSISTTTDGFGNATFNAVIPSALAAGQVISATATDPTGNTSEFSGCDASQAAGSVQFSSATYSAIEDVGNLSINLLRTGGSKGTLSVDFATGGGTATPGVDYVATSGPVTFADGETSKIINVPILDDAISESIETVNLTLTRTGAPDTVGAPGTAVLSIIDHNSFPILIPVGLTVNEGDSGTTSVTFRVVLSNASGKLVTCNYATAEMTATSGVDFQPVSGMLTFSPGVTEQTVSTQVIGDTKDENDETFRLSLSNPVNAGIQVGGPALGVATITDDDPFPEVSVNDVSSNEGNAGTTNFVFNVTLSAASGRTVSVVYNTANGSANSGTDYQSATSAVSFVPGETSKTITVAVNGDTIAEPDETFFVNLSSPNGVQITTVQGVGTILNDDPAVAAGTIQFQKSLYSVTEGGGSFAVLVTRSGDNSAAATVDYLTTDGNAKQQADYTIASGTLSFAAGETSKTFPVLITDDAYAEFSDTINLTLSNATGATLGVPSAATLTLVDNNDSASPTSNPIDEAQFFVTQHYFDFLNRSPDPGGLGFWTGVITQCGGNPICLRDKRTDVSNAFFYEQEFQQTGSYVYRVYREAFGNNQPLANPNPDPQHPGEDKKLPQYLAFIKDRARVPGGPQLAQAQVDFANAFVQRDEFKNKYPVGLDGPGFVDAVLATLQNDIGVNLSSQRNALIALFNSGGRGAVIYRLADDNPQTNPIDNHAFIDAEYNRAFVFTQYSGYLRRDADIAGFLFWLGQVSSGPLRDVPKQHAMVCSFITSAEYLFRFSPVLTHTNAECPQ